MQIGDCGLRSERRTWVLPQSQSPVGLAYYVTLHGMIWVGMGEMSMQDSALNRLGSFSAVMGRALQEPPDVAPQMRPINYWENVRLTADSNVTGSRISTACQSKGVKYFVPARMMNNLIPGRKQLSRICKIEGLLVLRVEYKSAIIDDSGASYATLTAIQPPD
jgi:hypothetical protein